MTIKELFAKHGVENADLLASVERVVESTSGIPQSRFKEVIDERNNLRADLEELESSKSALETKLSELGTELERLRSVETEHNNYLERQNQEIIGKWKDISKVFDIAETDPNFDKYNKIKADFAFGENLTAEQAKQNLKVYEIYDKAGFFGESEDDPPNDLPPRGKGQNKTYESPSKKLGL